MGGLVAHGAICTGKGHGAVFCLELTFLFCLFCRREERRRGGLYVPHEEDPPLPPEISPGTPSTCRPPSTGKLPNR